MSILRQIWHGTPGGKYVLIGGALFVACIFIGLIAPDRERQPTPTPVGGTAISGGISAPTSTPSPTSEPTATAAPSATAEPSRTPEPSETPTASEALKRAFEVVLSGGKARIKSLHVWTDKTPPEITGEWNISEALSVSGINRNIRLDLYAMLKALDDSGLDYSILVLTGYYPLTDRFGNTTMDSVIRVEYSKATIDKINWDAFSHQNVVEIADEKVIDRAIRE